MCFLECKSLPHLGLRERLLVQLLLRLEPLLGNSPPHSAAANLPLEFLGQRSVNFARIHIATWRPDLLECGQDFAVLGLRCFPPTFWPTHCSFDRAETLCRLLDGPDRRALSVGLLHQFPDVLQLCLQVTLRRIADRPTLSAVDVVYLCNHCFKARARKEVSLIGSTL